MSKFIANTFSSRKQDYSTPQDLFDKLNEEFHFDVDVCADEANNKVSLYYSEEDDALSKDWIGTCWMNPPFNNKKKWTIKAYNEHIKHGSTIVCLLPARTNTEWWHNYCMKGEIRFIKGRPIFKGMKYGLPQPLAIVIFGRDIGVMKSYSIHSKTLRYSYFTSFVKTMDTHCFQNAS